jgi:hypothetical protein
MTRAAPLIALATSLALGLALGASCKKQPPKGELPPASDWQAGGAPAGSNATGPATSAPPNPHAGVDNPHAGVDNPHAGADNPHAGADNPHAGADNPHAGMAGSPHGSLPDQTGPKTPDKLGDGRLALGPFSVAAPADWTVKPVTSSMRAADFQLPGKPGAEAELIVYYFGGGGAGSIDDNVNRWLDQFQQPDGKSSRDAARIEKTKFGGQDATYVSVTGRYVSQGMPGGGGPVDKADQALLAAIVASPSGPYYFKLVGAKPTVDASAKAFRGMLESLKLQ